MHLKKFLRKLSIEHYFLIISIPAIAALVYMVPPAWGLDEQVHTARAYQISTGNFYPDRNAATGEYGGLIPKNLFNALENGHKESNAVTRSKDAIYRKDIANPEKNKQLLQKSIRSEGTFYNFGPTGPYSPIVYMPAAVGMFLGEEINLSVAKTVMLAKVLQAALYVGVCVIALRILRDRKERWLIFLVALLPASIYQASTITADTFTISAVLLFVAIIFRLMSQSDPIRRGEFAVLMTASIALVLTKPSYAIMLAALILLPAKLFTSKLQRNKVIGIVGGISGAVFIIVSKIGSAYAGTVMMYKPGSDISLSRQLMWMLAHPIDSAAVLINTAYIYCKDWVQSAIGLLGYNTIPTPYPLTMLMCFVLIVAALYVPRVRKTQALVLLGLGLLSSIAVIVLLYATFNTVGSAIVTGVQGRYFIPCIPFMAIGIARFLPVGVVISARNASIMFVATSIVTLYTTVILYGVALF